MEDNTPILVGAGQFTERDLPPEQARPPMAIAAEAARAALRDAGIAATPAPMIDTVFAIRIFSDSTNRPRLRIPFGRAENPPRAIARRLGVEPANAIYGNVGGNTPQKYINEAAQRIADKDIDIALIAGAEAIRTARLAMRNGIALDWREADNGTLEDRGLGETMMTPHEFAHGVGIPIQTYPLFENALRGRLGHGPVQHLQYLGRLFEPFSVVAANNPFSFYGINRSAEELATVTAENRFIAYPYPKWMNAMDGVNMGAAVIMTSVGKARQLGIDPARWIFLHGCAEANEKILMSHRVNYHSSPALRVAARQAFAMAGKTVAEMNHIDLYSCFPSAVEIACDALELACFDERGLTVTGGLPFFGGPGNNYSLHGIATMLPLLRANRGNYGLITANGGYLSKHAVGIYSATPLRDSWQRGNPADCQAEIDGMVSPEFTQHPAGAAAVETYTVCFDGGVPEKGIVIGRLLDCGRRFIANTPADGDTLRNMITVDQLGRTGRVAGEGELNIFSPD